MGSLHDHTPAKRLFAFAGSDETAKKIDSEWLHQLITSGYTLLALDVAAVGKASEAEVPYTTIDDWIDGGMLLEAKQEALTCEQEWFRSSNATFTVDHICWPEFDYRFMHFFWTDNMLALKLCEKFQKLNLKELTFFQKFPKQPAVYYNTYDTYTTVWENELTDIVKPISVNLGSQKSLLYRIVRVIWRKGLKRKKNLLTDYFSRKKLFHSASILKDKIVVAFNAEVEYYRFFTIIQQMKTHFPRKIALAVFQTDQDTAWKIGNDLSCPIVWLPPPQHVSLTLQKQLLTGYSQSLRGTLPKDLWYKPLRCLPFHFQHYCAQRWPLLVAYLRLWTDMLNNYRPKAVCTSSLQDAESRLPTEAATQLGITTFSLPHGAVEHVERPIISGYTLYGSPIQKFSFEKAGIPVDRLIACRHLVAENEYSVFSVPLTITRKTWRVLALTDPIGYPGCLSPNIRFRKQVKALQILDHPPTEIAANLWLGVKVHPHYPDMEIFAAAGGRMSEKLLPINSKLQATLLEVDLVVAVNYYGSALIHSLHTGKPVIFLWTEPLIGKTDQTAVANEFLPGGKLVTNLEEFWNTVKQFFTNSLFARQMQLKAQKFSRTYSDDSQYPEIDDVVLNILSRDERKPERNRRTTSYL
jgi:hypothetical protein